ncbi:MAG: hypothetical protein ACI81I_001110, partial [Arcobacteraceae bacterium]
YIVFSIYIIYSNSYASTEINNIFNVSSGSFPVTTIFLTFYYALTLFIGILNKLDIYWLIFGFPLAFIILLSLQKYKYFSLIVSITIYISIIKGTNYPVLLYKNKIIKEVALKFDFNKNYYCSQIDNVDSVIFLQSDKLLVHYITSINNKEFDIKVCKKDN